MTTSRENFIDPQTGTKFHISNYRVCIDTNGTIYKDKTTMKQVVNPETGTVLVPIENESDGFPVFGKFNPNSTEGQNNLRNYFGSRSSRYDTKGAGRDTRDQKLKDFKGQIMERAKEGKL